MSLRSKVTAILLAVFAAYAVLDVAAQMTFVWPSFEALEREEHAKDMDRVVQALDRQLRRLVNEAGDYGGWNDTYAYAAEPSAQYEEQNFSASGLENINVNLLAVYAPDGTRIGGGSFDLSSGEALDIGELSQPALPPTHPLLTHGSVDGVARGLVMTPAGPALVASRSITNDSRDAPPRGSLIVARLLDDEAVKDLAEQARVSLAVQPVEETTNGRLGAFERVAPDTPVYRDLTADTATLYRVVDDIFGRPALLLEVSAPRAIMTRGMTAMKFAATSIVTAGLVTLVVLLALLQGIVVRPLARLTAHATALGKSDDLEARIEMSRKDEIGILAREFDRMVERLSDTRRRLLEQSYHSGIAEMASGVLHNIGNALTPLAVRVAGLAERLRGAPAAEMDVALGELAGGQTPAARREDLTRFVGLAGGELARVVREASGDLDTVSHQVNHITQILADQEKFSRAARVLEPVRLDRLLGETVASMGDGQLKGLAVEVDPALRGLQPVRAPRAALQQVFHNLILNAAEAMQRAGLPPGRVRVEASEEAIDGTDYVHVRFRDDGPGISPEHLDRIFERGFTTKGTGGSGLSLHWSANTIAALGGTVYAESEGPGKGACLHVRLPHRGSPARLIEEAA